MKSTRALAILVVGAVLAMASPARAADGFLKHLDMLMQNYAGSFYKEGSPGDVAEKFFRGGKFGLKDIDAVMKAYGESSQKVGEQALADLKIVLKDLMDFRTYLPPPLKQGVDGMVAEIGVLKSRFLARAQNPWGDDAGGGGAAADAGLSSADLGGMGSDPAMGDASVPAAGADPSAGAGGMSGAGAAAGGSSPASAPVSTSSLAQSGAASSTRFSGTRTPAPRNGPRVDRTGIETSLGELRQVRADAQRGLALIERMDAAQRTRARQQLMHQPWQMEAVLFDKLVTSDRVLDAFLDHVGRLDPKIARATFGRLVAQATKAYNTAALKRPGNAKIRANAKRLAALKSRLSAN